MKTESWRRWFAAAVGFVLSAFFLWLALRQVDGASFVSALDAMDWTSLAVCMVVIAIGIAARGVRWRLIAGYPPPAKLSFARATNLGVLANLLVAGRAGEVVKVMTLVALMRCPLSGPVASAIIDRIVDIVVLIACAAVLYALFPVAQLPGTWAVILAVAGGSGTLVLFAYARSSGGGDALLARIANRWLGRFAPDPRRFLVDLRAELLKSFSRCLRAKLIGIALLIALIDYVAIATLLLAFGLSLPWEAPLLLWVFLSVGTTLPSAPGYVGVYQVASVWALAVYAVPAPTAVAAATMLQLATLGVALFMAGSSAVSVLRRVLSGKAAA